MNKTLLDRPVPNKKVKFSLRGNKPKLEIIKLLPKPIKPTKAILKSQKYRIPKLRVKPKRQLPKPIKPTKAIPKPIPKPRKNPPKPIPKPRVKSMRPVALQETYLIQKLKN